MNCRNMVVLYNLTGSHTLLRSGWNHTELPSTNTVRGGAGWLMVDCRHLWVHFGSMFKMSAGRRTQRHPFLTLAWLAQRPEQGTKLMSVVCINVLTVQPVCTGIESSTALYVVLIPPLNGPHEPWPPSSIPLSLPNAAIITSKTLRYDERDIRGHFI